MYIHPKCTSIKRRGQEEKTRKEEEKKKKTAPHILLNQDFPTPVRNHEKEESGLAT